jgi:hypothetical protein
MRREWLRLAQRQSLSMSAPAETDWMAAMRAHDFARAWRISDRDLVRLRASGSGKHTGPRHLQTIWRGEPLDGRHVLVRCYHGLGDTIQFVRFLPALRRVAGTVTLWAQAELLALLDDFPGIDRLLPLHDGTPEVAFDVDIEVMELAHALRATPTDIAAAVPYLREPAAAPHPALAAEPDAFAVGLVWDVGNWEHQRAIPPHLLATLGDIPSIRLYSLRPGAWSDPCLRITDAAGASIASLAATMRRLDLVVTVDTMTAHLAGALGHAVWTLLPTPSDWRWGAGVSTPWYPTMRLFRQAVPGDWTAPLAAVARALRRHAGSCVRERT